MVWRNEIPLPATDLISVAGTGSLSWRKPVSRISGRQGQELAAPVGARRVPGRGV